MVPRERDSEKLKFWELISDNRLHKKYSEPEVGVLDPGNLSHCRGFLPCSAVGCFFVLYP